MRAVPPRGNVRVVTFTIVVFGHGPGISHAVARKFGRQGFRVALVARSKERLEAAAAELAEDGISARAFPCDVGDAAAVRATVAAIRETLGPIGIVHWNAAAAQAGDLMTADADALRTVFDVAVTGMVASVQASLPDLEAHRGAVLITGGGFALYEGQVDKTITDLGVMGIALGKAAQHKLAGLLHHQLGAKGVYVGEVVVMSIVKGTAFDQQGHGTLEADDVAAKFLELYEARTETSVSIP